MGPEIKKQSSLTDKFAKAGIVLVVCGVAIEVAWHWMNSGVGDSAIPLLTGILLILLGCGAFAIVAISTAIRFVSSARTAIGAAKELSDINKAAESNNVPASQFEPSANNSTANSAIKGFRAEIKPAGSIAEANPPFQFSLVFLIFPLVCIYLMGSEFNEVKVVGAMYIPVLALAAIGVMLCTMSAASVAYGRWMSNEMTDLERAQAEYRNIEVEEANARIAIADQEKLIVAVNTSEPGSALQKTYRPDNLQWQLYKQREKLAEILGRKEQAATRIVSLGGVPRDERLLAFDPRSALEVLMQEDGKAKPNWVDFLERRLATVVVIALVAIFIGMVLLAV